MIHIPRVTLDDLTERSPSAIEEELRQRRENYDAYLVERMVNETLFLAELEKQVREFPEIENPLIFMEWYSQCKNYAPQYLGQFDLDMLVAINQIPNVTQRKLFLEFYENTKTAWDLIIKELPPEVFREEIQNMKRAGLKKKQCVVEVKS